MGFLMVVNRFKSWFVFFIEGMVINWLFKRLVVIFVILLIKCLKVVIFGKRIFLFKYFLSSILKSSFLVLVVKCVCLSS